MEKRKYSLIRALQISWSLFSQELAGIATLLAQSMRGLAQYTYVMSHSHVKLHLKNVKSLQISMYSNNTSLNFEYG